MTYDESLNSSYSYEQFQKWILAVYDCLGTLDASLIESNCIPTVEAGRLINELIYSAHKLATDLDVEVEGDL